MLDFRISKKETENLDNDEFLWKIIESLWPSKEEDDNIEYISQATTGQKAIYAITLFIREVENGGIEQFLNNSSGNYINMVIAGLELVKADLYLNVFKEAITIFPKSIIPIERSLRVEILENELERLNVSDVEYFEKYNDLIYGDDNLQKILMEYVRNNEIDFFID